MRKKGYRNMTVSLTKDIRKDLLEYSEKTTIPMSAIIRLAVREYISERVK